MLVWRFCHHILVLISWGDDRHKLLVHLSWWCPNMTASVLQISTGEPFEMNGLNPLLSQAWSSWHLLIVSRWNNQIDKIPPSTGKIGGRSLQTGWRFLEHVSDFISEILRGFLLSLRWQKNSIFFFIPSSSCRELASTSSSTPSSPSSHCPRIWLSVTSQWQGSSTLAHIHQAHGTHLAF